MNLSLIWQTLTGGWLAAELLMAVVTRTRRGGGSLRDRGSMAVLWIAITASITACQWNKATHPATMFAGAQWLALAALALLLAGLLVRGAAIYTLGSAFSVNVAIRDSQRICRRGLYRYLRHPSYTGMLIIFLAIGVHSRNWLSLAVVVAGPASALLYRIQIEEAALRDAFGAEYAAYCETTKRLLPWIY
jgi:protein-S-isoprenylcysteine O-methyltransferase Ste14